MPTSVGAGKSSPSAESTVDRLLSRVLYGDSSARRRLLAGAIVGLTLWATLGFQPTLTTLLGGDWGPASLRYSVPSLAIAISLYLLGALVEVVGNVSLVRGAGEAFHAVRADVMTGAPPNWFKSTLASCAIGVIVLAVAFPMTGLSAEEFDGVSDAAFGFMFLGIELGPVRVLTLLLWGTAIVAVVLGWLAIRLVTAIWRVLRRPMRPAHPASELGSGPSVPDWIWFAAWWPLRVTLATLRGLAGRTDYGLSLHQRLSAAGTVTLKTVPERVAAGLENPIGEYGDLALHYLVERYQRSTNRKWARRLINRVRDVGTIVSAVVIALIIVVTARSLATLAISDVDSNEIETARASADDALTHVQNEVFPDFASAPADDPNRHVDPAFNSGVMKQRLESYERLTTNLPGVDSAIRDARNAITDLVSAERKALIARAQRLAGRVVAALAVLFTLFLYLIFFVTLRSAVISMVEALAIEGSEP